MRATTFMALGLALSCILTTVALGLLGIQIGRNRKLAVGNRRAVIELCANRAVLLDITNAAITVSLPGVHRAHGADLAAGEAFLTRLEGDVATLENRHACDHVTP